MSVSFEDCLLYFQIYLLMKSIFILSLVIVAVCDVFLFLFGKCLRIIVVLRSRVCIGHRSSSKWRDIFKLALCVFLDCVHLDALIWYSSSMWTFMCILHSSLSYDKVNSFNQTGLFLFLFCIFCYSTFRY